MPKVIAIGRNLGLTIERNITLGMNVKRGDLFILEPRPEAGEIAIKLTTSCSLAKFYKRISSATRIKDAKKLQLSLLKVKLALLSDPNSVNPDLEEYVTGVTKQWRSWGVSEDDIKERLGELKHMFWLPEEVKLLQGIKNLNPLLKKKLNGISATFAKHMRRHDAIVEKLNSNRLKLPLKSQSPKF